LIDAFRARHFANIRKLFFDFTACQEKFLKASPECAEPNSRDEIRTANANKEAERVEGECDTLTGRE
jgi:hypothetical protein